MKNLLQFFLICLFGIVYSNLQTADAQSVDWVNLEKAQEQALEAQKKVMIFAEAEWCTYCKRMHKEVFPKPAIQDSLYKYFYPVRVDIESKESIIFNGREYTQQMLSRKFRITSTPTLLFFDKEGEVIGLQPGYLPPDIFSGLLAYVGSDQYNNISFKEYLENNGIDLD
jgi:thioredoxin-related protein